MKLSFDVTVIGAGVAGISSAIYLKRAGLNVAIVEKNIPGGQINRTSIIENYPGFTNVTGPDLAYKLYEQVQALDIPIIFDTVTNIETNNSIKLHLNKNDIDAKAIIIAVGRKPRSIGLEHENELVGRGISYCAICDGALFKDRNVAVLGGGNSALEEATYLSSIAKKVMLIHRRDAFKAEEALIAEIKDIPNIDIKYNSTITNLVEKEGYLKKIEVFNNEERSKETIEIDGLFIAIGYEPDTEWLQNMKITDDSGYIIVDKNMKTKIPFVYACGDVIKKDVYQIITAGSEGAIAALSCIKDLD